MDQHTLDKLKFDHVRESLAACCACTLGKNLARKLTPSKRGETIKRWFDQVRQMQDAFETRGAIPLGGVHDIRPALAVSGTPAGLDARELHEVGETLKATAAITRWLESIGDVYPLIKKAGERVGDFSPLAEQIDRTIDERGEVRDDASKRLLELRRSIESLRSEIGQIYARMLRNPEVTRILQFPNTTQRGERTVLPLKTEFRSQLRGIVHTSSDTGSTLFIEPTEVVQTNNQIVRLIDEEHKEVIRILSQLSYVVHQNEPAIRATIDALAILDLISGKVRFAKQRDCICPIVAKDQKLLLYQARHPLLIDVFKQQNRPVSDVVPIDVRLGDDFDILVITGPNTGGKTVTLKTIGLIAIMAQSGIPIPAGKGSSIPVYRQIHIDVGDEQSIEQSLSTFSSHLSNMLRMLNQINAQSLVLLDELGAGTDPDEGAAIGQAIIDELSRIKCHAVLNTHLSALKAVAFSSNRVDNASVEFDVQTLEPTYRLRIGEPGNSNAIIIASRLGMSKRLVKKAKSYLSGRHRAFKKAIEATVDSRRQAERARIEANKTMLDAEQQRIHYQNEAKRMEEARQAKEEWHNWLGTLRSGDTIYVKKFERSAKLVRLQLQKQTAVIEAGQVEMEVPLAELLQPDRAARSQ